MQQQGSWTEVTWLRAYLQYLGPNKLIRFVKFDFSHCLFSMGEGMYFFKMQVFLWFTKENNPT